MGETFAPAGTSTADMCHLSILLSLKTIQFGMCFRLHIPKNSTVKRSRRPFGAEQNCFLQVLLGSMTQWGWSQGWKFWNMSSQHYIATSTSSVEPTGIYGILQRKCCKCLAFWLQLLHVKWHRKTTDDMPCETIYIQLFQPSCLTKSQEWEVPQKLHQRTPSQLPRMVLSLESFHKFDPIWFIAFPVTVVHNISQSSKTRWYNSAQ